MITTMKKKMTMITTKKWQWQVGKFDRWQARPYRKGVKATRFVFTVFLPVIFFIFLLIFFWRLLADKRYRFRLGATAFLECPQSRLFFCFSKVLTSLVK